MGERRGWPPEARGSQDLWFPPSCQLSPHSLRRYHLLASAGVWGGRRCVGCCPSSQPPPLTSSEKQKGKTLAFFCFLAPLPAQASTPQGCPERPLWPWREKGLAQGPATRLWLSSLLGRCSLNFFPSPGHPTQSYLRNGILAPGDSCAMRWGLGGKQKAGTQVDLPPQQPWLPETVAVAGRDMEAPRARTGCSS